MCLGSGGTIHLWWFLQLVVVANHLPIACAKRWMSPKGSTGLSAPHCSADIGYLLLPLKKRAKVEAKGAPAMVLPLREMGATLQ